MEKALLWQVGMLSISSLLFYLLYRRGGRIRERFLKTAVAVMATITGEQMTNGSGAIILEYKDASGPHKVHYPKRPGNVYKIGAKTVLYLDPERPERMLLEQDNAPLTIERIYLLIAQGLLLVVLLRVLPLL